MAYIITVGEGHFTAAGHHQHAGYKTPADLVHYIRASAGGRHAVNHQHQPRQGLAILIQHLQRGRLAGCRQPQYYRRQPHAGEPVTTHSRTPCYSGHALKRAQPLTPTVSAADYSESAADIQAGFGRLTGAQQTRAAISRSYTVRFTDDSITKSFANTQAIR